MDKRQNNKKQNKNKHKHNKSKTEDDSTQAKLTSKERDEIKSLLGKLVQEGVFESCINPKNEWRQYESVQNILQTIQQVEAPLQRKRESDNRLANIDKFYEWAKVNGLYCEGLEIKEFPDYDLGLAATRDIKKDDLLFIIPRHLILSEESLEHEAVNKCFSSSNMRLAFTLMTEAIKPDSFWKPYIDLLPDRYNTVLYYTVEEMAELKGSNALSASLKLCQIIASLYVNIYSWQESSIPIQGFKEMFSYDLLRWAVSTVMTRENLIPRHSGGGGAEEQQQELGVCKTISVLIPFWDMANHRNGIITSFFNGETQEMESKAQEDFKTGEQVFMYYGDRSNAEFMIHNGFVNSLNAKDNVTIKLGLSSSDILFVKRVELLFMLNIPKNSELKVLPPPVHISADLLAFIRVFNMNADQLDHWIKSERAMDLFHFDCALETELEAKTWQYLQIRLMLLLKAFPTTLEDDETLLEGLKRGDIKPKRNYIKMMLLEYRVMEKRILAAALDYVKQRDKA